MQNEHLSKVLYGSRILEEESKALYSDVANTNPALAKMLEPIRDKAIKIREGLREVYQILERENSGEGAK